MSIVHAKIIVTCNKNVKRFALTEKWFQVIEVIDNNLKLLFAKCRGE
jgi:hypothetical protein